MGKLDGKVALSAARAGQGAAEAETFARKAPRWSSAISRRGGSEGRGGHPAANGHEAAMCTWT